MNCNELGMWFCGISLVLATAAVLVVLIYGVWKDKQ